MRKILVTGGVALSLAAAVVLGGTQAAAGPVAGGTASPPPEPHIISSFASGLTGARQSLTGPRASVPVRSDVDGCNRSYGEASQCVPTTLPRRQKDLCAYLAAHGMPRLKVRGTDVLSLDRNRNRVACD